MSPYVVPEGDVVEAGALMLPRARAVAETLISGANDFARLIECRKHKNAELVVFEVDVEIGQIRRHEIQHRERLAAVFFARDEEPPDVLSLRKDFPSAPHLNLRLTEIPRSLCLYDERFRDIKRRWTAPRFIERIREWLALTAKGTLHQEDQPLEPLFFAIHHVILPDDLFEDESDFSQKLHIEAIEHPSEKFVCIVTKTSVETASAQVSHNNKRQRPQGFVAAAFRVAPQTHGVIRRQPATLYDLHEILSEIGTDFLSELRGRVKSWDLDDATLNAKLILIISFPKSRDRQGLVEATDVWTFLVASTLRELGKEIGLWDLRGKERGQLLKTDESRCGQTIQIDLLHSHFSLTRRRAALLNRQAAPYDKNIVGIGVGALGSQVVVNLARSAFGEWTLIDDDILFPHNLAKHGMHGDAQGFSKVHTVASLANSVIDGKPIVRSINADVLEPGDKREAVEESFRNANLILDMSASVTVARHLAMASDYASRRVSLFLTPTGDDLVVLAEDVERTIQLDSIEMQYYRAIANDSRLEGHFKPRDARHRYGQSCRDITNDIPQDLIALHAANGSRAIKLVAAGPAACITIWRADSEGNVRCVDIDPGKTIRHAVADWTICTDSILMRRLSDLRELKLPSETGGVLLGSFDLDKRIVYIVDTIPSPPDSEEWPTLYVRGCRGLKPKIEEIATRTDGMLEYIGEWHSHPRGCSTAPSVDDLQVFMWLTELMNVEGLPALMMIVGDGDNTNFYMGQMSFEENLLREKSS